MQKHPSTTQSLDPVGTQGPEVSAGGTQSKKKQPRHSRKSMRFEGQDE